MSYIDVSTTITPSLKYVEENNYYPFGLKHKWSNIGYVSGNGNATAQKYKFQKQERQDELGLNWHSFKWRNYNFLLEDLCV